MKDQLGLGGKEFFAGVGRGGSTEKKVWGGSNSETVKGKTRTHRKKKNRRVNIRGPP